MYDICASGSCTGCHACVNICPKHCISMKEDEFGFLYPFIDEKLCINCHLCEKTCPVNVLPIMQTPSIVYAAVNKSQFDYATATSKTSPAQNP